MNDKKSLRNISFVTIGNAVSTGLQAIFYLLIATLLEPELFGEMSYLIAIAGTFSLFSRFGLNQSVTVYQSKKKCDSVKPNKCFSSDYIRRSFNSITFHK